MHCAFNAVNVSDLDTGNFSSNVTAPPSVGCILGSSSVALPLPWSVSLSPHLGLSLTDDGIVEQAVGMEGDFGDSGSYLTLPFNGECALDPYTCEDDLSFGLFLKLTDDDLEQSGPRYIISAGYGNATGFDIYRNSTSVVMQVRDGVFLWTVTPNITLDSSGFLHLAFVFNQDGLMALIDGEEVDQVMTRVPYHVLPNYLGNVTLGARIVDGEFSDFASGIYDEIQILQQDIPDDANTRKEIIMNGIDGDDCRGVICQHGNCKDTGIQTFTCECDTGYIGTLCDENEDDCVINPCLHDGTCLDRVAMFLCDCEFRYEGEICEIDLTPQFNYSNVAIVLPEDLLDPNDELLLNPAYLFAQRFETMTSDESGNYVTVDAVGRGGEGTYARMTHRDSWMNGVPGGDMSLKLGDCLSRPDQCEAGFAASLWMMVDSSIELDSSAVILHAGANKGRGAFTLLELTPDAGLELTVGYDEATLTGVTKNHVVEFGHWGNAGITWSRDNGLAIYFNGRMLSLTTSQSSSPGGSHSPRMTFGTLFDFSPTAYPVAISDFVLWDRYLYPFEHHRFLGVTAPEGSYLLDAAYYWTTDGFLVRDLTSLSVYSTNLANTSDITLPGGEVIEVSRGRDSKGEASHVNGSDNLWFLLADLPGTCISDPFLCQEGVTLAIWARIYPVHDDVAHFIVSTGEQSTRGMSLYMRQGILGASLIDGDRKWITEIDFIPNPDEFVHLAISWRKTSGMALYKDGVIVSFDPEGLRKIREADLDTRIILGRRNDFLDAYSAMEFEELIFWEKYVETWEAREVFGLPEMEEYDDALFSWTAKQLITSNIDILMTKSLGPDKYIGPTSSVRVTENPLAVDLTHQFAALNLGSFSTDCITSPGNCTGGVSMSMWLKIMHGSVDDPVGYLLSCGRGDGSGIAIYKEGHDLVFLVETLTDVWATKINIQVIPNDQWSNAAVTWSIAYGITVYIDGIAQPKDNVTEVHVPQASVQNDHLTIGRPNDANQTDYANFIIHNLVIWDKYIFPRKVNKLTTLTDSQIDCIHSNKLCWPFESFLSLLYPYSTSSTGTAYKFDRNYNGRSIYTDGRTGSISLGNFKNMCPKRPSACVNGFTLRMWLQLEDNNLITGVIFSLGADVEDEQGIALVKDELGLVATVSDGKLLWVSRIYNGNFTYGPWMFLAVTWSSDAGVSLYIDGTDLTHAIDNGTESVRSGRNYNEFLLGRGALDEFNIMALFDDIELEFPSVTEALPDADDLTGIEAVTAYASADLYFDLATSDEVVLTDSTVISDRYEDESSAVNTGVTNSSLNFGYIDVGNYGRTCVSDPTRCTSDGLTISTWVKLNSLEHLQNNATNPSGLGYFISSGAQAKYGRGFSLTYDGQNMTATMRHVDYMITFDVEFDPPTDWFNLALSYSETQGLRVYVDGILIGSSTDRITAPIVSDFYTSLHLGKRNDMDAGYLGASFDDFATWFKTFEEDDPSLAAALQGVEEESGVVVTVNHPELDALAPFSGKPDCNVNHIADCSRTIEELNDVLNDESVINGTVLQSALERLQWLVQPTHTVPKEDLIYTVKVLKKIKDAPVYDKLNKTEATSELMNIVQITSDVMQPNRSEGWNAVNKLEVLGTPRLVGILENYGIKVSQRLRDTAGHEKLVISAEHIVMQVDSFDTYNHYEKYTIPDYNESNWAVAKESWDSLIDHAILPKNFFKHTVPGRTTSLVTTLYNTLTEMIPQVGTKDVKGLDGKPVRINSRVLSVTANPPLRMDLYNPMEVILAHNEKFERTSTEESTCAFWNYSSPNTTNGAWDTRGCELVSTNATITVCYAYHLTSFAVIIKPITLEVEDSTEGKLQWMARILVILSVAFLGVFLFYLLFTQRLRVILHKIHINLCLAVIGALVSLAASGIIKDAWGDCMLPGCLIHYFNTVIMLWMFIEAFQLFSDLTESLEIKDEDDDEDEPPFQERVKYYVLFGWGAPFLNVGVAFGFSPDAYIEQEAGFCWLQEDNFLWCAFVGPLFLFGFSTIYMLYHMLRDIDEQVYREDRTTIFRSSYYGTWILQIYFMLSWGVGLVGIYGISLFGLYLFVFTMSCFGILVFVVHAVLNTEVRLLLGLRDPDKVLTPIEKIHLPPDFDDIQYIKPTYIP